MVTAGKTVVRTPYEDRGVDRAKIVAGGWRVTWWRPAKDRNLDAEERSMERSWRRPASPRGEGKRKTVRDAAGEIVALIVEDRSGDRRVAVVAVGERP